MSGKQRNIRTKRSTEDEETDLCASAHAEQPEQSLRERMEETRLIQKQRKKTGGMDAEKLAVAGPAVRSMPDEEPAQQDSATVAKLMDSYVKATTVRETDEDPQM